MRRGCISLGEVLCDECHREIQHGERYLITEEDDESLSRLCVDCCLKHGYAIYKEDKKEQVLSFFVE